MTDVAHAAVVRAITRLNIGGPARQALLLTRELSDRHPTVLAAGRPAGGEGELLDPAVAVVRVPLVRPIAPPTDVRATLALRRLLRASGAEVLHTHMAKAGVAGRLAARTLHGVRTVHTFHGHVLEGYFRPSVQRAFIGIERVLARSTDVLVAISPEIRDELLDLGIGRLGQYEVIPLGFDLTAHLRSTAGGGALRRAIGLGPEVPLVGIVGRLVPIKDHRTTFEALVQLPGVHLAVIGDGELRTELETLVDELGLRDRVHFTGWWLDMPSALSDLDVVVLSSRNEGTPVALIEALACERPVVATDVGGVRSVVMHQRTGLLAPPRDPAALGSALASMLGDRAGATAMATAGRQHVREAHGHERLVTEIGALYDALRSRRR